MCISFLNMFNQRIKNSIKRRNESEQERYISVAGPDVIVCLCICREVGGRVLTLQNNRVSIILLAPALTVNSEWRVAIDDWHYTLSRYR